MAEAENVAKLPQQLPETVVIAGVGDIRMSPNEMRALKTETGKTLDQVMGENADEADRLQALVWIRLTREGHVLSWDDAGSVAIQFAEDEPADPTNGNA